MKMALNIMEKKISQTEGIPIIVVIYSDVISYAKGYHVYKNVQTSGLQEQVHGEIGPSNLVNKNVVAVKKMEKQLGIYDLGKMESLQKHFFISFELIRTESAM